jgi:hydroxymethylpyrimidine/phosphomethylpyrimidine kinase
VASVVAELLQARKLSHIVVDPVTRSSSGAALLDEAGLEVLRSRLLPMAEVITPNIEEAAELAGIGHLHPGTHWEGALAWLSRAADKLHQRGARNVVITGGHLLEPNDLLSQKLGDWASITVYPGSRIESQSTHGTGCAFATAIACRLAQADDLPELKGRELPWAVEQAKAFVRRAMLAAEPVGHGKGPLNHLYCLGHRGEPEL